MNKFMLSITASSGEFYQGDCEDLTLPISDGIYGVQAGHNPVLVALHICLGCVLLKLICLCLACLLNLQF